MIGRISKIGLCVVSALLASGLAVQSASAATGTTAFACVEQAGETGHFVREHCKPNPVAKGGDEGTGKFEHEVINDNTLTHIKLTDTNTNNEHTGLILKTTTMGVPIALSATEVHAIDTLENSVDPETGEHYAHGEGTIELKGMTEKELGCKVTGVPGGAGTIETKQLKMTTKGQGMNFAIEPKEGIVLAEFELTECAIGPTKLKLVGTLKTPPDGATLNFVHSNTTAQKVLRLSSLTGPVAGISATFTMTGMLFETKDPTAPVSFTTVETK